MPLGPESRDDIVIFASACAAIPDLGRAPETKGVETYTADNSFPAPATEWPSDVVDTLRRRATLRIDHRSSRRQAKGKFMLRLIGSEYSTHIRGNVRVYQSEAGDYKVDWRFSHGGSGFRVFKSGFTPEFVAVVEAARSNRE